MPLPNFKALFAGQLSVQDIEKQIEEVEQSKPPEYKDYRFYNDAVLVRYDIPNHIYYLVHDDGTLESLVSSSSVGKIIDRSDALVPWACKMMAEKFYRQTEPFRDSDFPRMTWGELDEMIRLSKTAHKDRLDEAGAVGTIAHDCIEQYIKRWIALGSAPDATWPVELPEDPRAKQAVLAAHEWMHNHNVRWLSTERKIYSRQWKYAGTFDGLCYTDNCSNPDCCPSPFKDHLALIDWKTSNHLQPEYILQVTSYMWAYIEETGEPVTDRWIIRLGKDDGEFDPWHLLPDTYHEDFTAFVYALELTRIMGKLKVRMSNYKKGRTAKRREQRAAAKAENAKIDCGNKVYTGVRKPKCTANDGTPCKTCLDKYAAKHPGGG